MSFRQYSIALGQFKRGLLSEMEVIRLLQIREESHLDVLEELPPNYDLHTLDQHPVSPTLNEIYAPPPDSKDLDHMRVWVVFRNPHNNTYFVGERGPSANNSGALCFPGGHAIDHGTPHAAALRELWEETGVDISSLACRFICVDSAEHKGVDHLYYLYDVPDPSLMVKAGLKNTEELVNFQWKNLEMLDFLSGDKSRVHKSIRVWLKNFHS